VCAARPAPPAGSRRGIDGQRTVPSEDIAEYLRALCGRSQISNDLLLGIQEFLFVGGWCLFCAAPTHFGLIKRSAVEGWARISSGRIRNELTDVSRGQYDFGQLEPLLMPQVSEDADQESD
jgi:hypothetical protein